MSSSPTRRDLTPRVRALWAVGTGLLSVGGFVGAFLFRSYLFRVYPRLGGEPLIVRAPSDLLFFLFVGGLGVSVAALLAYGFGSRFGPLGTRPKLR